MTLTQNQQEVIDRVTGMTKGCRFASFVYSPKSTGGKFRYTIALGISYRNLVKKDIETIESLECPKGVDSDLFEVAKAELLASRKQTFETGSNDQYTKKDTYDNLGNGVNRHRIDVTFEVSGSVQSRVELEPPTKEQKVVKSAPKTIVKNMIRNLLPSKKFRSFCLDEGCLMTARVNGETIEIS